jgi:hypothetical protein
MRQESGTPSSSFASDGQLFDLADDIVGEEPDCTGGEGRKAGKTSGSMSVERGFQLFEDVALKAPLFLPFFDDDGGSARHHLLVGLDADKGIAANAFPAFDGFEEEGFGSFRGDAQKCRNGSLQVGDDSRAGDKSPPMMGIARKQAARFD